MHTLGTEGAYGSPGVYTMLSEPRRQMDYGCSSADIRVPIMRAKVQGVVLTYRWRSR